MPEKVKVKIAEVAREANVSIATVSRVLNQREGSIKISVHTRQVVEEAAQRLGYQADPFASALRTRRSGLIGSIIRDIRDPFLNRVFRELQQAAYANGMELLLGHANYDIATAGRQLTLMSSQWFDGLILIGDIPGDEKLLEKLRSFGKPYLAVARGAHAEIPSINVDENVGTSMMLDYLVSLGHRRIAFLGNPENIGINERLSCFQQYIKDKSLTLEDGYLQFCSNNWREAANSVEEILLLPQKPTAIFCATDQIALGAINQLHRSGKQIPEDFSISGFDDIEEIADIYPMLTTIRQPAQEIAAKAIDLLLSLLEKGLEYTQPTRILIRPELVIRQSCAPLKIVAGI